MRRILVRPEELRRVAGEFRQAARSLRDLTGEAVASLARLEWEVRQQADIEGQVARAGHAGKSLAEATEGMASVLAWKADLFQSTDAAAIPELTALAGRLGRPTDPAPSPLMNSLASEALRWQRLGAGGLAVGTGLAWLPRQFPELFRKPGELGPVPAPSVAAPDPSVPTVDPFWQGIGEAPVISKDGAPAFAPGFADWADRFNARLHNHWSSRATDHAGTTGGAQLYAVYQLTPEKVERLWSFSLENHVDPRLMLAILQQEGTGSFNTNGANSAHFGGHGPQPHWERDLSAALEGPILSKLRLYPHAVNAGFTGTWVEWVNWYTPIDSPGFQGAPGVYAADINWAAGVERHYLQISQSLGSPQEQPVRAYSDWMGANPELFQPRHISGDFSLEPGLPPGGKRPMLAVWGGLPKPDYPGTYGPQGGFWWFPAPDEFCWHLVRR